MNKKDSRQRRARRGRAKIRELGVARLTIHRTPQHIYAQVIGPDGVLVAALYKVKPKGHAASLLELAR